MSKTQGIEQTGGLARREQEEGTDHLLNVGQVFPALKDSLDTATQALSVAPLELQEFGNGMLSHIARGGKDIEEAAEAYMRQKNFKGRERSLAVKLLALLLIPSLALAACASGAIAATPEKPIQPTVQMTETIQEPTEAPTQAPTTAPTEIPTEIPTAEPTPDSPYGHWTAAEAVTVKTRLTDQELNAKMEEFHTRFPLVYNPANGAWFQRCTLESISFLKEGNYISIGDYDIRVTGQCSYLDLDEEKQTITIALAVQNSVNKTTWMPHALSIMDGVFVPSFIQQAFTDLTTIEPGTAISVSLGWPNPINRSEYIGSQHHGDLITQMYSEEEMSAFIATKKPQDLNNKVLVPFGVVKTR